MENLGLFISEQRKKINLSQRSLAEKANISNTELWKIENGERSNPNPKFLNSIATALNIDPKILLEKAKYLNSEKINTNLSSEGSDFKYNRLKFIDIQNKLAPHIIKELSSNFNEDLTVENQVRINYYKKLDTVCFSKSGDIIAIDYKYIISNRTVLLNNSFFLNQLQKKVKSDFADFYFHYKKLVSDESLLTYFCVFILNESIDKLLFIKSIDSFFIEFKPIFKYKVIYENEV